YALNAAMRIGGTNVEYTYYVMATVACPQPYTALVRDVQSVIGTECLDRMPVETGRQPDMIVAWVGGGSNAMGIFYPYIEHEDVDLVGIEAAGRGLDSNEHSASITRGRSGVLHGNRTLILQTADG